MAQQKVAVLTLVVVMLVSGFFGGAGFWDNRSDDRVHVREVGTGAGFNYNASSIATFGSGRAGVYVTDFNNDHRPDILATGGTKPVLFENTGGKFRRSSALPALDITVKGALFFDYDTDGWEDLLLLSVNGSTVFLGNERGRFRRRDVGLDTRMHLAIGASAADYDKDGCLDLFVIQTGDWRKRIPKAAMLSHSRKGELDTDNGNSNLLFEGNCESFERIESGGIEGTRWSLATSFVDLTGDGYPDIHVGNDYNTDILYVNQRDGTFRRVEIPNTDRHAMASEVADVNGDGRLDVFVSNIHFDRGIWIEEKIPSINHRGNNLLINHGNGTFTSEERAFGVRDGGWGWAGALVDLDNDGDRDLIHATKTYLTESSGAGRTFVPTHPRIWERTGGNFTRLNASRVGFETSSGRGLAHLDYDLDGDQDIVVANHNGVFKLYENRATGGHWVQIDLESDGTPVLGSQVYVITENRTQYRVLNAKADFLSQDTRTLHFGLKRPETVTVRVVWPNGTARTFKHVSVNRRLVISRDGTVEVVAPR